MKAQSSERSEGAGFIRRTLFGGYLKLIVGVAAGIVLGIILGFVIRTFSPPAFVTTNTSSRDSQIIQAVTKQNQVVLLSLGIQGIAEKDASSEIWGLHIPGSERATFLQYRFNAKLGINGGDVTITKTGKDSFEVLIPNFIFIGHDNETFNLVTETNGVLSFLTPEIDPVEMVNAILNPKTEKEYITQNKQVLVAQSISFYRSIITSIDPEITVTFKFQE